MAFRIYDEYELNQFMNKGLSPNPIVVSKGTGYSIVNYTFSRGEYENHLSANNGDSILVSCSTVITSLSQFSFEIEGSMVVNNTSQLCSRGTVGANGGIISFYFLGSGLLIFELLDEDGIEVANVVVRTFNPTELLTAKFTFINSILYFNGVQEIDLSGNNSAVLSIPTTRSLAIATLSYLSARHMSMVLTRFSAMGDEFPLNEPSGDIARGLNRGLATRITSSLDPDYINDVMIQPVIL
tara:strand:+ start:2593 stop:3312 length:720 start_codon:yes stop_codon:yes gene_type:complete